MVDNWCKNESQNMRFYRNNQKQLRADLYAEVLDSIDAGTVEGSGRIILPSNRMGSDRYMNKTYQNAMAFMRVFNTPTFFLTVTANQK